VFVWGEWRGGREEERMLLLDKNFGPSPQPDTRGGALDDGGGVNPDAISLNMVRLSSRSCPVRAEPTCAGDGAIEANL